MAEKIIIIGGGAAGLTAAVAAASSGAEAVMLEAGSSPGKKLLSTGNGRCNLTNLRMDESCYRSGVPEFVSRVLNQFGPEDTLSFFRDLGLWFSDRNGYIYPRSEQASAVRTVLEEAVKRSGTEILTGQKVISIQRKNDGFHLETAAGKKLLTRKIILAAGGAAAPKTGSDGSGYLLAKSLGHTVTPLVPALVPLYIDLKPVCKTWKGVRVKGKVRLLVDGMEEASDTGELQLTDYGISGIPVFQVSRYAGYGLQQGKKVSAVLDFLPDFSEEERKALFMEFSRSDKSISVFLSGLIPSRLADAMCSALEVKNSMPCYALKGKGKRMLSGFLTGWELPVTAAGDFEAAQVTAGGVDLREVNPGTMESLICPGLYFAGELLDADGICGGYNLQWAWSTGTIAGKSAAKKTL